MTTASPKNFILIVGPPAVGKMTVGSELSMLTGLKLFHNHQAIDPVLSVFDFGTLPFMRLVGEIRTRMLEEVVASELPGLILTFVWDFDSDPTSPAIKAWTRIIKEAGHRFYMAEILADLETRKLRNRGESRLLQKSSKRDLAKSEEILLKNEREWRMKAPAGFDFVDGFTSIECSNLSASETARRIKGRFGL